MNFKENPLKKIKRKFFQPSRWLLFLFYAFLIVLSVFIFKSLNDSAPRESSLFTAREGELVDAPDFSLKNIEGDKISLSDFRGNNVLLVFWATWCPFCRREMPDLKNFTEEYKDKIKVLAITEKESQEVVQGYIEENQINFEILMDTNGQVWNSYLIKGTPTHFLINGEGKIVASRSGYTTKEGLNAMASLVEE